MGCAWGVCRVCKVYERLYARGMCLVCMQYTRGMHVVWAWYERGADVVCTWYARGLHVVYTCFPRGMHVVCTWCACCMFAVCTGYARGMHVVCTRLHVVCTWCACGMHALRTYLQNSSTHLRKTCTGLGKTAVLVWQPKHKHHVSRPPKRMRQPHGNGGVWGCCPGRRPKVAIS